MMRQSCPAPRAWMWLAIVAALHAVAAVALLPNFAALADDTLSPATWTPVRLTDFAIQDEDNFPWFQLWIPEIGVNNAAAKARGVVVPAGYQASLNEAHWWIRSGPKMGGISILEANCDPDPVFSNGEVVVSLCPTKTIVWEPPMRRVKDQPKTCFLRPRSARAATAGEADYASARNGMFMAFDVVTQAIKTGVIVDHRTIDACTHYLSLKS